MINIFLKNSDGYIEKKKFLLKFKYIFEYITIMKLEKPFNSELLYNHIVHYYIDKKGITKEEANKIAQKVITRELQRYVCKDSKCGHLSYDHIKNQDTCIIIDCPCTKFVK
jgi:hypothetical protein